MRWCFLHLAYIALPPSSVTDGIISRSRDTQHPHQGLSAGMAKLPVCKLHSLLHLFLSQAPLILLDFFQILLSLLCYTLLLFFNSFHSILLEGLLRDELLQDVDLLSGCSRALQKAQSPGAVLLSSNRTFHTEIRKICGAPFPERFFLPNVTIGFLSGIPLYWH